MAASTSADSNNDSRFDVFINYTPLDVGETFARPLYRKLISYGLRVFLDNVDNEELLLGGSFVPEIDRAIRTASVHVAIFFPGFANSYWRLKKLVLMLESGAPILPVFCGLMPSEVRRALVEHEDKESSAPDTIRKLCNALFRVVGIILCAGWSTGCYSQSLLEHVGIILCAGWSTGCYSQSLLEHEDKESCAPDTIRKLRSALSRVVDIPGFQLYDFDRDQGALLDKVVQELLRRRKNLVGLHEKVEEFESEVLRAKPQVVGIVGVGGVGKTTLAKKLFDQKRVNYSKCCFLPNVREKARLGLLNSLQRQLLKSLTGKDALINNNIDEGKETLKNNLSSWRVLMVLDDVDNLDQIDALLPVRTHLLSDSLVVITSRDEGVIRSSGVENASIYHLTGLNHQYSRELFCAFAFNWPHPRPGFESLVDNFLEVCEGLPLFLRVFGALLNDKDDQSFWKYLLDRLQQVLPGEAQEKLQISYQTLNWEEQQIFLDSACFFLGQKRDTAIRIWEGSLWEGHSGFHTLQRRCLLGVDDENNIEMQGHLRDFGRAIADTSSLGRLMHYTDMLEQLSVTTVTDKQVTAPRGIRMVPGDNVDDLDIILVIANEFGRSIDMRTLQLLDTENAILERLLRSPMEHFPRSLIWLRWNKCPKRSLPSWIPMRNLRVLQVSGSVLETLWEDDSQAPVNLRELEINAPLSNLPRSIGRLQHLERFVVGKFVSGQVNLTKLPVEFSLLHSLTALVLTDCSKMKSLPEFFALLSGLQHIDLSFCRNLEMLPSSFISLSQLGHINLSDCHDLKIPDSIGHLDRLRHIDMRGCHNLERIPDSFGHLRDLRHINLSGCHDLQRLPDYFGELKYLQHIDLQGCHNLEDLPTTFGDLMNLEYINLSNCHNLVRLPESFVNLSELQHIDLSGCHNLERLPYSFRNLKKLKYLDVEGCSNLIINRFEIIQISDNLPVAHQSQLEQLYE